LQRGYHVYNAAPSAPAESAASVYFSKLDLTCTKGLPKMPCYDLLTPFLIGGQLQGKKGSAVVLKLVAKAFCLKK
jgi:hypothetical protein